MKRTKNLMLVLLCFVGAAAWAQTTQSKLIEKYTPAAGELGIAYEKWELPNGLTLIIHEDHSDPIAHVEVTYHVGSARESMGKSGFAHFFEHMMFQGSKHVADEEHFKIIQGAGGEMNGTTSEDRTNYFETVPANMLETALWLESDRMGYLLDSVTQKKFEVQRATVKNEKSQNVENQPYAMAFVEILGQKLYPKYHPYSWPTIGYVEDLNSVTVDDLKNFFMRWYGPNNAIVVVAGDVDPKNVLALTEKYFGPIKKGKPVGKQRVEPVILGSEVYAQYPDNIYFPMNIVVYPTVPNYHKDEPALDLLAEIFGGNNNSVLYKNLVKNEKAIQVQASHPCRELAGEFQIVALSFPKYTQEEILTLIRKTIADFDPSTITDDELNAAKTQMENTYVRSLESIQGKSGQLTQWTMLKGNLTWNIKDEMARYNAVTKADLVAVFNKYIKSRNACIVNVVQRDPALRDSSFSRNPYPGEVDQAREKEYVGLTYVPNPEEFDRFKHPVPGVAKTAVVPEYYKAEMANGLKVIGTKTTEVPTVDMILTIKGGHTLSVYNPKTIGLARLTADMMNEGTKRLTTEQFSAELNKLGSSISVQAGRDNTQIVVTSLTKNLDKTLALFEEVLMTPRFDKEDFKRVKNQAIENYYTEIKNANLTAGKAFNKLVYGDDHIYGASSNGTAKTLDNITLEDVTGFYNKYYSPTVSSLTVVGNVSKDEIMPKLEFLKKWEPKKVNLPALTFNPNNIEKTEIYVIDKVDAPQSAIRIGAMALPYDYKGDFFKSQVMNFPLGGNFNSRVNLNLREDKGWTYGARTSFTGGKNPGTFNFSASVKRQATDSAVKELFTEIEKYKNNGITQAELDYTKNAFLQSDALNYETSFQKAGFLNLIEGYSLPEGFQKEQNAALNALTKEDIDALAKKYLNTSKMAIVVVGDKEMIKKGLESLGYGKLKSIDPDKISVKQLEENANRKVETEVH